MDLSSALIYKLTTPVEIETRTNSRQMLRHAYYMGLSAALVHKLTTTVETRVLHVFVTRSRPQTDGHR